MAKPQILVVDDEAAIRFGLRDFLGSHGYEVVEADSAQAGEQAFRAMQPDVAIVDYLLPDGSALELLPVLKGSDPNVPVVILTGHGSIDLAVRAIKEGAEHFLTKPLDLPSLLVILQRLVEQQRTRRRHAAGRSREAREEIDPFLGPSPAIRRLAEEARKVVTADSSILLLGETGTGKGILARWLHDHGPRAREAFVDVNCAGLARDLLESELFGYEKGAFTGAVSSKHGLLEVAHRGTAFLDEIADMSPEVQPKLLKVLEEKQFRRLGGVRDRQVDVRLVAATHQELARLVREGKFRDDLYFRISAVPLVVSPLRERVEDIPGLAARLLERLARDLGRGELWLSDEAIQALQAYAWPGNIRELRNVLERAALLTSGNALVRRDLRFDAGTGIAGSTYAGTLTLKELERRHIEGVLREEGGHVDRAAARLGIPRSSLYQKLRQFGISGARARHATP